MGKPHAQRQKEYLARLKERDVKSYRKKDAKCKQIARERVKLTPALYENQKAKDRLRKQKLRLIKYQLQLVTVHTETNNHLEKLCRKGSEKFTWQF